MDQTAETYCDILDGVAAYFDSAFLDGILDALRACDDPGLGHALNGNQIRSKRWLVDALHQTLGGTFATVYVLGGWYGVLGAMLLHDRRFRIGTVVSVDIEPQCEPMARNLNRAHVRRGQFETRTADVLDLDYGELFRRNGAAAECLLICTSCEHFDAFAAWYDRIPAGTLLALQSNDYFACPEHVNCVPDLAAFARQTPMAELHFEGGLRLKKYTRFMRVGRK